MNPYKVLGLDRNASDSDIKKAYHKLVMQYHPDKNPGDKKAEEKFKEINNAYDILKDPVKKQNFDRFGSADGMNRAYNNSGFNNFNFHTSGNPFEDIFGDSSPFNDLFGNFGFKNDTRKENLNIEKVLNISLKESYTGCSKTIYVDVQEECEHCYGNGTSDGKYPRTCAHCNGEGVVFQRTGMFANRVKCPYCQGKGVVITNPCQHCSGTGKGKIKNKPIEIKIPAGIKNDQRLRCESVGHYSGVKSSMTGKQKGDVIVHIHVLPEKDFVRLGDDLQSSIYVPFSTLVFGGEVDFKNIDDKVYSVKIMPGTEIGTALRLAGKGFKSNYGQGNLFVTVKLDQSKFKNLTTEQKELIGKLKEKGL